MDGSIFRGCIRGSDSSRCYVQLVVTYQSLITDEREVLPPPAVFVMV